MGKTSGSERPVGAGAVVALALAAVPLFALITMHQVGGAIDPTWSAPTLHFWVVSVTAFGAGVISAGFMLSLQSLRNTRTAFLALGFAAVALIFMTHGLGTPGLIISGTEYPYAVIISAGLSEVVGAFFIALSVMPAGWLPGRVARWGPFAAVAGVIALGLYVASMVARPSFWAFVPNDLQFQRSLAGVTLALLAFAIYRYWRAWRLTRFPAQLAMVIALVLLAESQVSMTYGTLWRASWWLYHGLMLAAFLTLVAGWAIEARRARSLILFARALTLREALDELRVATVAALEKLEGAMETKDEYTRHHMGRVATYAVATARELGCDALTVELVEAAGRIHDIGKIAVPDSILLKPGVLTAAEFEQMKHHAERGSHIAASSKALAPVAGIVRGHHERFAGGGYPDGLAGDRIPLAARIVAVADTFDALTSNRTYRSARPLEESIAELRRVAGTQLDPDCVRAFLAWFIREGGAGVHPESTIGQRLLAA